MNNNLLNVCDYDAAHLGEALGYQMRSGREVRNLFLIAAALIILGYSLYVWLIGGESKYWATAFLSVVMLVLLAFTNYAAPMLTARRQAAKIREVHGGSAFRFEFREEDLGMTQPSGEQSEPVAWDSLTRAAQTRDLILVFTKNQTMLILDRSGFQNGTEDDFWRLISEKCPSLLISKK